MNIYFGTLPFSNNGRIICAQYWIAAVICIHIVLMIVAALVLTMVPCFGPLCFAVAGIIYIAVVVSGVAVGIKRPHDCNNAGTDYAIHAALTTFVVGVRPFGGVQASA